MQSVKDTHDIHRSFSLLYQPGAHDIICTLTSIPTCRPGDAGAVLQYTVASVSAKAAGNGRTPGHGATEVAGTSEPVVNVLQCTHDCAILDRVCQRGSQVGDVVETGESAWVDRCCLGRWVARSMAVKVDTVEELVHLLVHVGVILRGGSGAGIGG